MEMKKEWLILTKKVSTNLYVHKNKYSRNELFFYSLLINILNLVMFFSVVVSGLLFLEISPLNISFLHLILLFFVSFLGRGELYSLLGVNGFINIKHSMPIALTNKLRKYLFTGAGLVNGKNGFVLKNEKCVIFYSYVDRIFCVWDVIYNKKNEKWRYVIKEQVPIMNGMSFVSGLVLSYNFNLLSGSFNKNTTALDVVKNIDLPHSYAISADIYTKRVESFINESDYVQVDSSLVKKLESKININMATEDEITDLPGISAIMAKKIIKFRETTRLFESIDDFIKTMKIKPHFEQQIRLCICVMPVEKKETPTNVTKGDRNLDF